MRDQPVYGCQDESLRETISRGNADFADSEANRHCPRGSTSELELFRGQQQTHDSATVNKVIKVNADERVSTRQGSTEVR